MPVVELLGTLVAGYDPGDSDPEIDLVVWPITKTTSRDEILAIATHAFAPLRAG